MSEAGFSRQQAFSWAHQHYAAADMEPAREIMALYCAACGANEFLFAPQVLTPAQTQVFRELVERRCAHEPLQHLLKEMFFGSFRLFSSPDAFIVRPENLRLSGSQNLGGKQKLVSSTGGTI